MSRIGKKPILLPAGVSVELLVGKVAIKGPKGALTVVLPPAAKADLQTDPAALVITVENPTQVVSRAQWGLARQLLQNAVTGVQASYNKSLEFVGVGFKVALEGQKVAMDLGFSHRVFFPLPVGIEAKVEKQVLTLSGIDKQLIGETAARIRRLRPPEPYKGKGIKYIDEVIRRKAGKTAKTSA